MGKVSFQPKSNLKAFRRDETGSVTVEFVIWFPILLMLISLVADASMIFYGKAHALRTVQDGNRLYSVGRFSNETDAAIHIRQQLQSLSDKVVVDTTVNSYGVITSTAQFPAADLVAIGLLNPFTKSDVIVRSQHLKEYPG